MTAQRTTTRRWLIAASVAIAAGACSNADRDAVSTSPPTAGATAPDFAERAQPNHVLPPEGAGRPDGNRPAAEQIARESAGDAARAANEVDWSGGDPAHGQALYATHCAICHGGGGAGDGIATPALNPKPRDFRDGRFYLDADANNRTGEDVDLARVIQLGPAAFGGSREMVGFRDALSDRDIRDLIAHVRTLAAAFPAAPAGTPVS